MKLAVLSDIHGIVYPEVWHVPMTHDSGGVLAGGL